MKRPRLLCSGDTLFGVYPHGMRDVAIYEIEECCKGKVEAEYPEVNALRFSKGHLPVGCLYNIFIYIGIEHIKEGSIQEVEEALERIKVKDVFRGDDILKKYKSWRVRGYRYTKDGMVHKFNSMDLEKVTADCINSDNVPVDLSDNVEVEVIVWLYGYTIVIGYRPKEGWDMIDAGKVMSISKGNRNSRAPDAVSFCIAHLALMNHKVYDNMIIVDPMCGVGSYLFAMYFILVIRSNISNIKVYGYDEDEEAINIAKSNANRLGWNIIFEVRDCAEAVGPKGIDGLSGGKPPIKADLVLVDPPWGHRHLTHSMVRKLYPRWSRSWLSLLKDDKSLCVVVTIRTSHMEKEILPHLRYRVIGFQEVSRVQFDNMGFGHCTAYLWSIT